MALYNKFSQMPFIPYRILEYLAYKNENIWKILKYDDYRCLEKPQLTFQEKMALIWTEGRQEDYRVFMSYLVEDLILDSTTILKIFKYNTVPTNTINAYATYEFNVLYGGKISVMEYEGVPCSRGDVVEREIMKTLNGSYVGGVGTLQFNTQVSPIVRSSLNIGNNKTFEGITIYMGVFLDDIGEDTDNYECK